MREEYLDKVWKENPNYIRRFYDNIKNYERLCGEIEYILTKELNNELIEYSQISSRAKTVKSFCEKIARKKYNDPFSEITDFAGVRVVYLYSTDRARIESVVEDNFDIIEKVDKITSADEDQFGYGALHYLVRIKENHSGARYDDLQDLVCEVQIRTILQDSWAVVAHHLSYKQESDIPAELRRKLNALSGLFETADDQFEFIRSARESYRKKVTEEITQNEISSFNKEINLDNLNAYLKWKYPERGDFDIESLQSTLSELKEFGYKNFFEIESVINRSLEAVEAYEAKYPPADEDGEDCGYNPIGMIRSSLSFVDESYLQAAYPEHIINQQNEFLHLVKKNA